MAYQLMILSLLASLSIAHADIEPLNTFDATRKLMEGVQFGSVKQVQFAIAKGADVHDRNAAGRTPLMIAALNGNQKIIDLLIEAGANPNQTDDSFNTPLFLASRNCNHRAVISLLKAKADVNRINHVGQTALHAASEQGCDLVVLALLKVPGIRFQLKDDFQRTALDYATETADIYGDDGTKNLITAVLRSQSGSGDPQLNVIMPAVH